MGCFSFQWLEQVLVWLVIIGAIVAILRLLIPWIVSMTGVPIIGQALEIILWAIIAIYVIYFIFALLGCLGGGLPTFPHAR